MTKIEQRNEMRVMGLVPARGGSKGIVRKNVQPIAGKPLIAWTIEAALKSPLLWNGYLAAGIDDAKALVLPGVAHWRTVCAVCATVD